MIVTLDGQRIDAEFGAEASLLAVVQAVRSQFAPQRMIVGVTVNGAACNDNDLADRLATPIRAGDQIDLESADRQETAVAALRGMARCVTDLSATAREIADDVCGPSPSSGLRELGEFLGAWQSCGATLARVSELLEVDLLTQSHVGETVDAHLRTLFTKLAPLRDALEARDLVSVADVLRYEMPEQCELWAEILESLAESIARSEAFA